MKTTAVRTAVLLITEAFALLIPPSMATAQTRQFLDAPVVRSLIRVRWNVDLKAMQWAADNDDTFRAFPADAVFLTKRSVYVGYPHLNPLTTIATATITAAPDPSYAVLTQLLTALAGFMGAGIPGFPAGAPGPGARAVAPTPSGCTKPDADAAYLSAYLHDARITPSSIKSRVKSWPAAIDTNFGAGLSGPKPWDR